MARTSVRAQNKMDKMQAKENDSESSEETDMVEEHSWANGKEIDWDEHIHFEEDSNNKVQQQTEDWEKDLDNSFIPPGQTKSNAGKMNYSTAASKEVDEEDRMRKERQLQLRREKERKKEHKKNNKKSQKEKR